MHLMTYLISYYPMHIAYLQGNMKYAALSTLRAITGQHWADRCMYIPNHCVTGDSLILPVPLGLHVTPLNPFTLPSSA